MRTFKFIKDIFGRWYVVLPEWPGAKEDLEMVEGADTLLDILSEGLSEISLILSEQEFPNADKLKFKRLADEIGNGAHYYLETYKGIPFMLPMWLCDVTYFVFSSFPEIIYFSKQ